MKKGFSIIFISLFLTMSALTIWADNKPTQQAEKIVNTIYGKSGVHVPFSQLQAIKKLINNLLAASPYQKKLSAEFTIQTLHSALDVVDAQIKTIHANGKEVPTSVFYKKFLIKEQIKHIFSELHNEDYANIVLFLTHLTDDPLIINELLLRTKSVFSDEALLSTQEDSLGIDELAEELSDRKSTRLNSSHTDISRMPSSA